MSGRGKGGKCCTTDIIVYVHYDYRSLNVFNHNLRHVSLFLLVQSPFRRYKYKAQVVINLSNLASPLHGIIYRQVKCKFHYYPNFSK